MGFPSNTAVPAVACSNPARMLSKVDLPHPEGPSKQTNSPSPTVRDTLSRATYFPRADSKVFRTLLTRSKFASGRVQERIPKRCYVRFEPPYCQINSLR